MKTYYRDDKCGFANEYTIHAATDADYRKICRDAGYRRITRKDAVQMARYRGNTATRTWVECCIDGVPCWNFADWFNQI